MLFYIIIKNYIMEKNMPDIKYNRLLKEKFPTRQSVCTEIINLNAILNLPKGTEHFMSDLHGEYEAFYHILNNCSGMIKEKVSIVFGEMLSENEQQELCTLIYYPKEKLCMAKQQGIVSDDWYRERLHQLIEVAKLLSSKYTRSKVRKALPADFAYIIDELIHVQKDEDDNQVVYHRKIIDTIIEIKNSEAFIVALASLIKRLAVDHLHIVGDIFDRGEAADKILDVLLKHHSLDIEWGNHDILWMGAACGNEACIANVIQANIKYRNTEILEQSYGISLRKLFLFAEKHYGCDDIMDCAYYAVSAIMFKLEGQLITNHPEYEMSSHLLLDKIDMNSGKIAVNGKSYNIDLSLFPTLDAENPYELTNEEKEIMKDFRMSFLSSRRLALHIDFLYEKGSIYRIYNNNLLYHGCIPMNEDGNFTRFVLNGIECKGKEYMDLAEKQVRLAYRTKSGNELDFMWYLWCGRGSPLSGRNTKVFEKMYISEACNWIEEKNNYYNFYSDERICRMILHEFGIFTEQSHIINGHTPVRTVKGEKPTRANGKLIIIDGGFSEAYHKTTGIAGYTLIFNSHGLRIKAHQPFESMEKALENNFDITSVSEMIETENSRVMVRDTDIGKRITEEIDDLKALL